MSAEPARTGLPPRDPLLHNSALVGAFGIPLVMLLPPRRLDFRFFILGSFWSLATNRLAYEYTGESIPSRVARSLSSANPVGLPENARKTQELLREQRQRNSAQHKADEDKESSLGRVAHEVWLGGQGEDWKQKRAEEDRRKLEEGMSIFEIIMEQVGDVFSGNWRGDRTQPNYPTTQDERKPPK